MRIDEAREERPGDALDRQAGMPGKELPRGPDVTDHPAGVGDGLTDVVISDPGAAELIWYKQAAGVGLAEPARFPCLAEADALSAADIDGDGKSELGVLSIKEKAIGISKFECGTIVLPESSRFDG